MYHRSVFINVVPEYEIVYNIKFICSYELFTVVPVL